MAEEWTQSPFTLTKGHVHSEDPPLYEYIFNSIFPDGGIMNGAINATSESDAKQKLESIYPGIKFVETEQHDN